MLVPPCKFFNTPNGCKFTAEECKRPHEVFCTNGVCVRINKSHTHSLSTCGLKSQKEDVPTKPLSTTLTETRKLLCEKIFFKVEQTLKETESETDSVIKFKPTAGKVVGMFYEGLDLKELTEMLINDTLFGERMADAVDLLRAHAVLSQ